jgi:hypothetical protein
MKDSTWEEAENEGRGGASGAIEPPPPPLRKATMDFSQFVTASTRSCSVHADSLNEV